MTCSPTSSSSSASPPGAGLFLKFQRPAASTPTEATAAAPADAPASVANPNENYDKGYAFEQWVADRFKRDVYKVKHWRSDKRSNEGVLIRR
ncbi:MAG: hypothetical protein IPN85_18325 [Flavobacteriales bacterium]|nr:hypothetical protein [Flavobacteriales bacterium]